MNKFRFAFQAFALVGLFLVFSAVADAQSPRTWVSAVGDDANLCTRLFPCKTFTGALPKTTIGGEIDCLDPGNYGSMTITKSITIDCEDTQGAISAAGVSGININITNVADTAKTVRIRGLSINGLATGLNGVKVIAANKVVLEEVIIDGFSSHGVSIVTTAGALSFVMKDTTIRNNVGNGVNSFLTGAATATLSVESSLLVFNDIGFNQGAATTATLQNSGVTNNATGIQSSGSTSVLSVKDCTISLNTTGILTSSSGIVRIGNNIITSNGTGISGSNIFTWGGNFVDGNIVNGSNSGAVLTQ
jgi:hypothetical protein